MVARRWQKGESREWKIRKLTDNNDAAKQWQTADEEKNKKGVLSWSQKASCLTHWSDKILPCLSSSSRGVLLDC